MAEPVIVVDHAGIRFKRNRRHRRSFKDLFAESSRRSKPDEFWALRDVSFSVAEGEAIGVVGRNGQGKSTLLKLVAGVMLADEGQVQVTGGVAPLIEITGGFVDDLSVRDNVYLTAGLAATYSSFSTARMLRRNARMPTPRMTSDRTAATMTDSQSSSPLKNAER